MANTASNSGKSYDIYFNGYYSISRDALMEVPQIYFTAGNTINSCLRTPDELGGNNEYRYTISPNCTATGSYGEYQRINDNTGEMLGNKIRFNIARPVENGEAPAVSWSAIVNYLIDTHENTGGYTNAFNETTSGVYYPRWFGRSAMRGTVPTNGGWKNYSDTAVLLAHKLQSKEYYYNNPGFGAASGYNESQGTNYYTDAVPNTIARIAISKFNLYAEMPEDKTPPAVTIEFNKGGTGSDKITVNHTDWQISSTTDNGRVIRYCMVAADISGSTYTKYAFTTGRLYNLANKNRTDVWNLFYNSDYTDLNIIPHAGTGKFDASVLSVVLNDNNGIQYTKNLGIIWRYNKQTAGSEFTRNNFNAIGINDNDSYNVFFAGRGIGTYGDSPLCKNFTGVRTDGEDVGESPRVTIPYQVDEDDSTTGVHMFNTVLVMKDLITVTLDEYDSTTILNTTLYIGDVELACDAQSSSTRSKIVGSNGDMYMSGYMSGLSTLATCQNIIDIANGNNVNYNMGWIDGVCVSDVFVAPTVTKFDNDTGKGGTVQGYNYKIVDPSAGSAGVGYVMNSVEFYAGAIPKMDYVEGSLTIDGFSTDDLNGRINATLDAGSHLIGLKVKNSTKYNVITYPQVFSIKDNGEFMDASGLAGNTEIDTGKLKRQEYCPIQLNVKSYGTSSGMTDFNALMYSVRIDSKDLMFGLLNYTNVSDNVKMNAEYDKQVEGGIDTGMYENGHLFYEIKAGEEATVNIQIEPNSSDKPAVFAVGMVSMIAKGSSIDAYSTDTRTVKVFNESYDNKLPAFIQMPGSTVKSSGIEYMFNDGDQYGPDENIVNVGEEAGGGGEFNSTDPGCIVFDSKTFEIKLLPRAMVEYNGVMNNYDALCDADGINGLCLTEDDLVFKLRTPGEYNYGKESKFKYTRLSNTEIDISEWIGFDKLYLD